MYIRSSIQSSDLTHQKVRYSHIFTKALNKQNCWRNVQFSSVQSLSRVRLFANPWIAARQASLFITISRTHVHRVRDAIQPSHPRSSPSPPVPNPSQHQSLFAWGGQSTGISALASFLPKNVHSLNSTKPRNAGFKWTLFFNLFILYAG